jgi:hypothetical protein
MLPHLSVPRPSARSLLASVKEVHPAHDQAAARVKRGTRRKTPPRRQRVGASPSDRAPEWPSRAPSTMATTKLPRSRDNAASPSRA